MIENGRGVARLTQPRAVAPGPGAAAGVGDAHAAPGHPDDDPAGLSADGSGGTPDGRFRSFIAGPLAKMGPVLLVAVVVGLFVLGPILLMIPLTFRPGPLGQADSWGLDSWRFILNDVGFRRAFVQTFELSLVRQVISIVVGLWIAWLIARTDLPGRHLLEYGFWIAVFLPPLTVALGWILLLDPFNGIFNRVLLSMGVIREPIFNIYSFWGITWVQLLASVLPIKVMLLVPALRNLDAAMEEASYAVGADRRKTFRKVVVPLMLPPVLVAFVLGLIRSMESFEVELILGLPAGIEVLSARIYRIATYSPPDFSTATTIGTVSLLLLLPAVIVQQRFSTRKNYTTLTSHFKNKTVPLGKWRWPAFAFVAGLVSLMTIAPFGFVLVGTFMKRFGRFDVVEPWTTANWTRVLGNPDFTSALKNTLILAVSASVIAIFVFTAIAYILVRSRTRLARVLDVLVWLPSMMPGIVIGLGYLTLFLVVPGLRSLYGTMWVLVIVISLGSITLSTQMVRTGLVQLGANLEEASRSSGASWLRTFRRIVLPLLAPTLAVVGILAFSSAVKSTGHVALLSTSRLAPLSILQLRQMGDNNLAAASVVGVILIVLTGGVAIVLNIVSKRLRGRGLP